MADGRLRMGLISPNKFCLGMSLLSRSLFLGFVSFIVHKRLFMEIYTSGNRVLTLLFALKNSSFFDFKFLSDLAVTDFVNRNPRFKLSYNLISKRGPRVFIHTFAGEGDFCSSVTSLFHSAGWAEREAWDLYGVYFLNHGDLRRILTDYGFKGFPFRKDFPLTGYIELRFDDQKGDVVYEPVELAQEMRFFNFATGWEVD